MFAAYLKTVATKNKTAAVAVSFKESDTRVTLIDSDIMLLLSSHQVIDATFQKIRTYKTTEALKSVSDRVELFLPCCYSTHLGHRTTAPTHVTMCF